MRLVEQHIIRKGDPRYAKIDAAAFASKNLWNAANYLVRQSFIFQEKYLNTTGVFHQIKSHEAYQALPRKVSNQVLIQLHDAWRAFFEAIAESATPRLNDGSLRRSSPNADQPPLCAQRGAVHEE